MCTIKFLKALISTTVKHYSDTLVRFPFALIVRATASAVLTEIDAVDMSVDLQNRFTASVAERTKEVEEKLASVLQTVHSYLSTARLSRS